METEDNRDQVLEKRTEKIKNWFKDPYNKGFFFIMVFAIIIRIFYFNLTQFQPVWWDEAEYMNIARAWAFGQEYWFDPVRQILFAWITSLFLRINNSEFLPRALLTIFSIASVSGMYYLGKEIYNKKIGLIASFLMSIFYLNLFFTYRILSDIPSLVFFIIPAIFFYRYFKTNSHKALYIASITIGIGTLFKLTTAALLFVVLIYLLTTEKLKIFKKKEIWIAGLIFLLVLSPYLLWGYMEYGEFVIMSAQNTILESTPEPLTVTAPRVLMNYIYLFPSYLFGVNYNPANGLWWYFSMVIIFASLAYLIYKPFLGFDILLKKKNKQLRRDYYLALLFLVPLILVSILITHNENRYILNSFPALFILTAVLINKGYYYIKNKKSKVFAILFLVIILGSFAYVQHKQGEELIKGKLYSYAQIKDAGLWIRDNSNPSDVVFSTSAMQTRYYSERDAFDIPATRPELESLILEKNPRYYMVSAFERSAEPDQWLYAYPNEKQMNPVHIIFADVEQTQPFVIVYEFSNENSQTMENLIQDNLLEDLNDPAQVDNSSEIIEA